MYKLEKNHGDSGPNSSSMYSRQKFPSISQGFKTLCYFEALCCSKYQFLISALFHPILITSNQITSNLAYPQISYIAVNSSYVLAGVCSKEKKSAFLPNICLYNKYEEDNSSLSLKFKQLSDQLAMEIRYLWSFCLQACPSANPSFSTVTFETID